jgi:hypothetical protein
MFKIKKLATYEVIQYFWSSGSGFKPASTFMELLKEVEVEIIREFRGSGMRVDEDLADILTEFWEYVGNTQGYATEDKIKKEIEMQYGDYKARIRTFMSGSGRTTEYVITIDSKNCRITREIHVGRRMPNDV